MDQRLTEVEAKVASLNTQLTKLQELIDGKQFITGIEKNEDGTNVISFVNAYGELSTITLSDGKSPDISVKQAADGKWYVSYDHGVTYVECGKATGNDGDAFFKDARLSEDGKTAYLTLADGTVLTFEIYKEFGIAVEVPSTLIYSGQTKEYAYTITGGDKNTVLEVIPKGNWEAEVKATDEKSGVIAVTAPDLLRLEKSSSFSARETRLVLKNDGNIVESIIVYQNPVTYPDDVMVLMMQPNAKDSGECLPASFGKAEVKANANEPAKGFYRF